MSYTEYDPQNYDPYLARLREYERKLKEVHQLLEENRHEINLQDYKALKKNVEEILTDIKTDIERRQTETPPEPDYDTDREPILLKFRRWVLGK